MLSVIDGLIQGLLKRLYEHVQATSRPRLALELLLVLWLVRGYLKENGYLAKTNIAGRHILVTGAAMGLGRGFALKLAQKGAKVTMADVNLNLVQQHEQDLAQRGQQGFGIKMDVSSWESVQKGVEAAVEKFGPVDILINNAGIVNGKTLIETSPEQVKKIVEINTISHMYLVKMVLPSMLQRNTGHIVTIASMAGVMGVPGMNDYCASKFGAVGFD